MTEFLINQPFTQSRASQIDQLFDSLAALVAHFGAEHTFKQNAEGNTTLMLYFQVAFLNCRVFVY